MSGDFIDWVVLNNLVVSKKFNDAKAYINKFFFNSLGCVYFRNGSEIIKYKREDAIKLIPTELKIKKIEENHFYDFSARQYIKSLEFIAQKLYADH